MKFKLLGPLMVESSADIGFVRAAKQAIASAARLRYDIAHEMTHELLILSGPNHTGMSATTRVLSWLTDAARVDRLRREQIDELPASATLLQLPGRIFHGLPESPIMPATLAFREDALSRFDRAALLRLLDGILTALCLALILVLAALARLPEGLTFVLVMLAACLRYGRRDEPGDHAFLSRHRYRKSTGSSPQD